MQKIFTKPHKRLNILTGEWVKVSPHRTKRPWQGAKENLKKKERPAYDPDCYLCPGNKRAGGIKNPEYKETYSFINDFATLIPEVKPGSYNVNNLLQAKTEKGICKVICFSPCHNLSLPCMKISEIEKVIKLWIKEYQQLGKYEFINHIQVFENHGLSMGCSNPHPHGQIWCDEHIPNLPAQEMFNMQNYYQEHGRTILQDYLELELKEKKRIVIQNDNFVVLVPFWAVWPYETMLIPRRPLQSIDQLNENEITDLADIIKKIGIRYDNLFQTDFPYSMGIHQQPTDNTPHPEWHFHFHYLPPLLRSASIKKFMVGYELMAMPQRDINAEDAARILSDLSEIHYKDGEKNE